MLRTSYLPIGDPYLYEMNNDFTFSNEPEEFQGIASKH